MRSMIVTRKSQMAKAANMMMAGEKRTLQIMITAWKDAVWDEKERKHQKLREFFMDRNEW